MKLSTVFVLITAAVAGIANAAESNGNLRAVDRAPIFKKDDTKDNDEKDKESRSERIATLTYQDGLQYCTDPGKVSEEEASELSSDEVEAQVDNCIEEVINVATAGDSTKRSILEPSTTCAHECGDIAAETFEPSSSQCSGSLGSCKSCKKKDLNCSEYLINFKKGGEEEEEEKKGDEKKGEDKKGEEEGKEKDDDNEEEEERKKKDEEEEKKKDEEEEKRKDEEEEKKKDEEEEKRKDEEEGEEEDDDNEEEERQREYQKCIKNQEKEDEDYKDCVEEEDDCEDYLEKCEREQKKARNSLESIPAAFDKCISEKCPPTPTESLSVVEIA